MPLMSPRRLCCLCSPRPLAFLTKRDLRPLCVRVTKPASIVYSRYINTLSRMPTAKTSQPDLQEPSPKRRKIGAPAAPPLPRFIQPYGTMAAKSDSNPTTLELTEVETKLRNLLLDVAAYIEEAPVSGAVDTAVQVPEELTKERIVLRFTGGWVRDKLLGVGSHDIDVAINNMTGEHFGLKMIEYLEIPGNAAKHGLEPKEDEAGKGKPSKEGKGRKIAPGLHKIEANPEKSKNLETATTKIMGIDLDLVNLRKETYNEISRNPQMEFGTPEEDAMRRDATVNAMFYNLNTSQIEDFTGRGFQDMEAKIIRTPLEPYQTFKDDPLRVLRLIRFASRLDYTIDPATEQAMSNQEIGEVLKIKISRERVGIELEKMLKGPRPFMALSLINRLGLYETIFTDPTRDLQSNPDTVYFSSAYKFIDSVLAPNTTNVPQIMSETLASNSEERYLAWICASVIPWADAPMVPHQKPTQRPYYAAYLVAREGFKAPNRVCDVIAASLQNGEEIRQLVDRCYNQLRRPNSTKSGQDATSRDVLGMAIRHWGPSWRTQVLFNLTYEIVLDSISRERLLDSYSTFLTQVSEYSILEAHTFKPLITGTELAKALNAKPGPWMKDALDVVMAWQLRNPDITDPTEAIEAVKASREQNVDAKNSELPSALASHFLQLTIRPSFSQTKPATNITPAGHVAPASQNLKSKLPDDNSKELWKDPKNASVIELLRWSLMALDQNGVEKNWGLLIPPVLKMMDDIDLGWKGTGCELLALLLRNTPTSLLKRTGLSNVFEESLFPLFTYLPTLTEENDSILLLDKVFPALMALANVIHPPSNTLPVSSLSTPRERFLDKILRDGIIAPLFHAPPSAYPKLATLLLSHLSPLLNSMGIDSVKHLQPLTTLFSNILAEPLGLAYPPLMIQTSKVLQTLIQNSWPRVSVYRAEITKGICLAWIQCLEETDNMEEVENELREIVDMLDAVFKADEVNVIWEQEKKDLIATDHRLVDLLAANKD